MTQYMISVATTPPRTPRATMEPIQPIIEAVDTFNEKLQDAGIWVFGGGLEPPTATTTVDNTGTELVVTDGPFVESKEYLGGFWVIEAADLDAALKWAAEGSKACARPGRGPAFQTELT